MATDNDDHNDLTDEELLAQLRSLLGRVPDETLERAVDVRERP